jgi:decaprenylphospho-beta-D-erythro-pentofuranosid-2-ulose 2-reductase
MSPQRVLVLGGTSEIAAAIVRELAAGGPCEVVLAGRDPEGLRGAAQGLLREGCTRVETIPLEARSPIPVCAKGHPEHSGERPKRADGHPEDSGEHPKRAEGHREVLAHAIELLGGVELVILAVGVLGERGGLPENVPAAVGVLEVNVVGAGSLLLESVRALRERGHGTVVVLSSVAAERPRAANAVYCASKAGLDALAQGLSDALRGTGIGVMVVRPGFVRTRMTRGLPVPPLASDPQTVARLTVRGLRAGAQTVWVPAALRWVMLVLRLLPRPIFRRLPL